MSEETGAGWLLVFNEEMKGGRLMDGYLPEG
jgi:hypothetical protein